MIHRRLVLITGGTGMIGQTIARRFLDQQWDVIVTGSSEASFDALHQDPVFQNVVKEVADVSSLSSVQALMQRLSERYHQLDALVTAAGIYGEIGSIEQCDPEAFTRAFSVNVFGTWWCIKYALPLLRKSDRARIITFAGGGEGALPRFTSYASSKAAVLRMTESLAEELKDFSICINAISPGLINSGFVQSLLQAGEERVGKKKYEEAQAQVAGVGGSVTPDRAAELVVFLANEPSGRLTGKNLSAVWDAWETLPEHLDDVASSDLYTSRRIKPKDRGYAW